MSRELLEKARWLVDAAKKRGAKGVRASVYRSRNSSVEWRDGKVDRLRESTSMAASVTLFVDGRYSANSTSDMRPQALEKFLDENIAATRLLAVDSHRKLPDPASYRHRFKGDLKIHDKSGSESVETTERRDKARALEDAARSSPGADKIISVTAQCSDSSGESAKVNSNGMEGSKASTSFVFSAVASVRDEGDRKPRGWWAAVNRFRDKLGPVEPVGREATRRALLKLGGKPEKSGQYPCVVENVVAPRLLGWLLAPLYGNSIQQKRSFLADKKGQEILSPLLTIIDDPHIPGGLASGAYDSEGMSTVKRPVFTKGVLENFYLDTYYASKLGLEPTSGSNTNLVFGTGKTDLKGLLGKMDTGILITDFSGGNSNSATGDFSVGVKGQWIEKGEPVRAVAEMNLAGNHLTFWKQLLELGNDPHPFSSMLIPSLRFDKIQFSGV
jgi:PmbA protein